VNHQTEATVAAALAGAALGAAGNPIIVGVIAAAFFDLATGYWKAMVLHTVNSNRLGRGLYKILAYLAVGASLTLIGHVGDASQIASNGLAGAFLLREFLSVVENLYVIGQAKGVDVPAITLLVRLLKLHESKLLAEAGETGAKTPETDTTHV
jgi:phage-related holin